MAKTDFKRELRHLYRPSKSEFSLLEVPPMRFLMIDGRGDPNTAPAYEAAIQALYSVAYTLKFMSKNDLGKDYVVPPLEGLWWATDMQAFTQKRDKRQWLWSMMIMVPDWIVAEMVTQAQAAAGAKKELPALPKIRCACFEEGLAVQILHIGPYDEEGPVLQQMHTEFLPANNLTFNGKHHEIYLSDPRRVAPDKLKTILRQPVRRI